eukprot:COSAG02_NODE_18850_length_914_cov_1.180368_1_plen_41_part_10
MSHFDEMQRARWALVFSIVLPIRKQFGSPGVQMLATQTDLS